MTERYNLEKRTLDFAKAVRLFVKELPKNILNNEDGKQLVRSSGSVGANYIEANESLGKKDFMMRIRIARKEAKESRYWLELIESPTPVSDKRRFELMKEAKELVLILSSILQRFEDKLQ